MYMDIHKKRERERQKQREAERQEQRQSWVRLQGCIATQVPVKISLKATFAVLSGTPCFQIGSEVFVLRRSEMPKAPSHFMKV